MTFISNYATENLKSQLIDYWRLVLRCCVIIVAGLALFASFSSSAFAQGAYRIIVMGEDSDPAVVRRSNDIYKRVTAEIRRPMRQSNYDVLDEDMIAADLGFVYPAGMEKREVIQAVMLANKSRNVNNRSRFLSLIRVHVFAESLSFTKEVHVRLDGELYDMNTNLFIEAYEIPETTFPAPVDCNDICLVEKAGGYARDMAANLGAVLTKQLNLYLERNKSATIAVTNSPGTDTSVHPSSYTFTLKNFQIAEANQIVKSLRDNAVMTVALDLVETDGVVRRYQFVTSAKNETILDTLNQLLNGLGLREKDANVAIANQTVTVEKLKY